MDLSRIEHPKGVERANHDRFPFCVNREQFAGKWHSPDGKERTGWSVAPPAIAWRTPGPLGSLICDGTIQRPLKAVIARYLETSWEFPVDGPVTTSYLIRVVR